MSADRSVRITQHEANCEPYYHGLFIGELCPALRVRVRVRDVDGTRMGTTRFKLKRSSGREPEGAGQKGLASERLRAGSFRREYLEYDAR